MAVRIRHDKSALFLPNHSYRGGGGKLLLLLLFALKITLRLLHCGVGGKCFLCTLP